MKGERMSAEEKQDTASSAGVCPRCNGLGWRAPDGPEGCARCDDTGRESPLSDAPTPAVGQLWWSLDPRDVVRKRTVEVEAVVGDFVYVRSFLRERPGRHSRIHSSRFDGKQYRLVAE